ncbi:MAG: LamG domain-containing protein, partial [Nanoarchaeota archaeon]
TPGNNTKQTQQYFDINVSIKEPSLKEVIYNWNGNNYTIYNDSLVLMLNFDNVTSIGDNYSTGIYNKTVDLSKFGNNGTMYGPIFNKTGRFGGALEFDGNDDYVEIPSGTSATAMTGDMTVSYWINLKSGGGNVVMSATTLPIDWKWSNRLNADGSGLFGLWIAGGWKILSLKTGSHPGTNTWFHFTYTRAGSTGYIYINGILKNSTTQSGSMPTGQYIHLMKRADTGVQEVKGTLDEVRIWNRSLSAAEIQILYMSNLKKYDNENWSLSINQSKNAIEDLDDGDYTYQAFASDGSNWNYTEQRTATVSNFPIVDFVDPTPLNATITSNTSTEANVSIIKADDLDEIIWNWNGTNFTMFNDSLVLMFNFDNVSALGEDDTHVFDVSGNGNNGTVTGAVVNMTGKYGGAFTFDGNGDYLIISDDTSIQFGEGAFSLSYWIKRGNISADGRSLWNKDIDGGTFYQVISTAGVIGQANLLTTGTSFTQPLSQGIWYLVTTTRDDSGNVVNYINGNVDSTYSGTAKDIDGSGADLTFSKANNYYFNGSIDEVRIYNRFLSADEVYQHYISNLKKYDAENWSFYINQSLNSTAVLTTGVYTYHAFAKDAIGNLNHTEIRTITIISFANITNIYPNRTLGESLDQADLINISIKEPNNITFNITYTGSGVTINWTVNRTEKTSFRNKARFNWSGNYTQAGDYLILVNVSTAVSHSEKSWILTVNNTDIPPASTLNAPSNNNHSVSLTGTIIFNCSGSDSDSLANVTLYSNLNTSAGWFAITNRSFIGTVNSTTFSINAESLIGAQTFLDSSFIWNCFVCDSLNNCNFASVNYTFSGWDIGTYGNTTFNTSGNYIGLLPNSSGLYENLSGNYTSRVFNATYIAAWLNISWDVGFNFYNRELPGNMEDETLTYSDGVNMSGNVLLFRFNNDTSVDENSTHVYDWSGNDNNGTSTVNNSDGSYRGPNATGKFVGAYKFDGVDDYISVGITGGTITTDGLYTVHTFYSNGTFKVPRGTLNVSVLVVAGGGGGSNGGNFGGGGGAGELVYNSSFLVMSNGTSVTVGNGGANAADGGNSTFGNITATGGSKGSGLTGGKSGDGYTGGTGSNDGPFGGGGGAGSSENGISIVDNNGGPGGAGTSYDISGALVDYAGGGGGAGSTGGAVGAAGGGSGGYNTAGQRNGGNATANSGSGGGGAVNSVGGLGGSGIVIVRYLTPINVNSSSLWIKHASTNIWEFVSYNGSTFFKNGKVGTPTSYPLNTNGGSIKIGVNFTGSSYFNGTIDEVAIWNRSLSAAEIQNIYKRGALRLNLSARTCNDPACDTESFTNLGSNHTLTDISGLTNNQYFQYKFNFETDDANYTPQLTTNSVTIKFEDAPPNITKVYPNSTMGE